MIDWLRREYLRRSSPPLWPIDMTAKTKLITNQIVFYVGVATAIIEIFTLMQGLTESLN